jgi:hypothetical protein
MPENNDIQQPTPTALAPATGSAQSSELLISGDVARRILINVHAAMWRRYRGLELWVLARDITGHGSGYSQEICRSAGLEPNQRIGKTSLREIAPNAKS